jgi:hypothetical protein
MTGGIAGGEARAVDAQGLPELAAVWWRPRTDENSIRRTERLWLAWTAAHTAPFVGIAALLAALNPLLIPISLLALAQAWIIPELYAARGADVLRPRRRPQSAAGERGSAQRTALGLLGDLLDHRSRALSECTGLVLERGELGVWLLGEAGAVLVRPGGRRVHCYCVKAAEAALPAADRTAHLLLALRADESGFATVANLCFCGARWRLRHRLKPPARRALDAAVEASALRYASGCANN